MRRLLSLALLSFLVGCGDNSGTPPAPDASVPPDLAPPADLAVTADEACQQAAEALCALVSTCENFALQYIFGDQATCVARFKISCLPSLMEKGTSQTPASLADCVAAIKTETCDDFFGNSGSMTPPACNLVGTLGNGSSCADDNQCMSHFCAIPRTGGCGTCSPAPMAGSSCLNLSSCGKGLVCNTSNVCTVPVGVGNPCDGDAPCGQQMTCVGQMVNQKGTCMKVLDGGATCDPNKMTTAECNFGKGFYCKLANLQDKTGTCSAIGAATTGQPCGVVNGNATLCIGSGHCQVPQNQIMGTCLGAAPDGTACDPQNGPVCMQPAGCYQGLCHIFDPTVCN
jgi:hypothetical protein